MPRRKITKAEDLKAASPELPDLTPNQMEFARGLLAGMTASDAYRGAYSTENYEPATLWANASRARSDSRVQAWLSAAREACLDTGKVTLDGHLTELQSLKELAKRTGNVGAAVQAEHYRGKAAGLYVERYEDVTQPDPLDTLEFIRRLSPEAALALANKYGKHLLGNLPTEIELPRAACVDVSANQP